MSDELRDQIYNNLNLKETDDLIEIWQTNDRVEWSELAFDAIKQILQQRLGEIPPQDDPIFEYAEDEDIALEDESAEEEITVQILEEKGDLDGLVNILEKESDALICLDAAQALAKLGDQRGVDYLSDAIETPDPVISNAAQNMLRQIKGANFDAGFEPVPLQSFGDGFQKRIADSGENLGFEPQPVIMDDPLNASEKLNEKYPYLMGWVGLVALMALASLIIGFIPAPPLLRYVIVLFVGFYIFKFVVEKNILPYINQ